MKDPITLLVAFKDGHKTAELDITTLTYKQVAQTIITQEMQGRKVGYEFTNREKMKERRESYE